MIEPEWTDNSRIDTVGDMIRALSFWCPDTRIEFVTPEQGDAQCIIRTEYAYEVLTFVLDG